MHRYAHRVIFSLFALSFIVAAPTTVLWTAGYRYSLTRQRIEKTGILQLASTPKHATVSINNQVIPNVDTPTLIASLLPNSYPVAITKPGYLTWNKNLTIESGKSTFAEHIVLIRDTPAKLITRDNLISAAWDSSTTRLAALADINDWLELITIDDTGRHLAGRLGKDTFHPRPQHPVMISPDGTLAAFIGTDRFNQPISYLGSAEPAKDGSLHPFRQLANTRDIHWLSNDTALAISDHGLTIVDPTNSFTATAAANGQFDDAAFDGAGVVAIHHESGRNWLVRAKNTTLAFEPVLALPDSGTYSIISAKYPYIIIHDNNTNEGTLINLTNTNQQPIDASSVDWGTGASSGQLLTCTDVEIAIVDLATNLRQIVTRQAGPITDCQLHPLGHYVFYRTNTNAYLIETDNRDIPVRHTLFNGHQLNGFAIDPKAKTAALIGTIGQDSGVWRRELE